MSKLVNFDYEGFAVTFKDDGWFSATSVAKQFGKEPNDWLRQRDNVEYVIAICKQQNIKTYDFLAELNKIKDLDGSSAASQGKILNLIKKTPFVKVKGGSPENGGGTWLHRKLFVKFMLWLNPKIIVEVLEQVTDTMVLLKALDSFEVPDEIEDMFVYAIRNTTTGNIKLGISKNPRRRLEQLQVGNDCKLELVAYKRAENKFKDEVCLHNKFSAYRIHGEWFSKEADCVIT